MHPTRLLLGTATAALFASLTVPIVAASQTAPSVDPHTAPRRPPVHIVQGDQIPAGAQIDAVLDTTLSTDSVRPGMRFTASVSSPFYDSQGRALVPVGAQLLGRVRGVSTGTDANSPPRIDIQIEGLIVRASTVPIAADVVSVRPTMVRDAAQDEHDLLVRSGSPIRVRLVAPVAVLALRSATTERAYGGGPRQ